MAVRLSTSYSSLAGTNTALRIRLTPMTARRRLRIWDRDLEPGGRAPTQTGVGVALPAAVGVVVIVTEDTGELVSDMSATMLTSSFTNLSSK